METNPFEQLQALWDRQPAPPPAPNSGELIQKAQQHLQKISQHHRFTMGILAVTVSVLVGYFIWAGAYQRFDALTLGLGEMIGALLVRIGLEAWSLRRFRALDLGLPLLDFGQQARTFYRWRSRVHLVFTPIIYLAYVDGFATTLLQLRDYLSPAMFMYCLVTGFGFLIGFGAYLVRPIGRELGLLKRLRQLG
jgi:hypothetical protein